MKVCSHTERKRSSLFMKQVTERVRKCAQLKRGCHSVAFPSSDQMPFSTVDGHNHKLFKNLIAFIFIL